MKKPFVIRLRGRGERTEGGISSVQVVFKELKFQLFFDKLLQVGLVGYGLGFLDSFVSLRQAADYRRKSQFNYLMNKLRKFLEIFAVITRTRLGPIVYVKGHFLSIVIRVVP